MRWKPIFIGVQLLLSGSWLFGQERVPRVEFGPLFTLLGEITKNVDPGFGARVTVNATRIIGFDGELVVYPDAYGDVTTGFFGIKLTSRERRWAGFLRIQPGFLRVEDGVTRFAMLTGFGLEFFTKHIGVRFDLLGFMYARVPEGTDLFEPLSTVALTFRF